jgi:hypothetical protein
MALFTSYAQPGVYTDVVIGQVGQPLFGSTRIPVLIGEGVEEQSYPNIELFRGSSAIADDQSVAENISDQVTGLTNHFNTTFFPVVDGTGKAVTTNDPTKIQVLATDPDGNVTPVTVISLSGATGAFVTQQLIPVNTTLKVTYFFKRGDTQVIEEDQTAQIPAFAILYVSGSGALTSSSSGALATISVSDPGILGNNVSIQLVSAVNGQGVSDAQAVVGAGSNAIVIEIKKTNDSIRTVADLVALVGAGIPTADAGFLTISTSASSQALAAGAAHPLAGGDGQGSNTVFKVNNSPIVDGTNGGVVTNDPRFVVAKVNGVEVAVAAVDGLASLITLADPVQVTATSLQFTYYFNTWQHTYDLLPASNVSGIVQVGLGPDRSDYTQGTDYSLGTVFDNQGNVVANSVNWGNNVSEVIGVSQVGETANFTPAEVLETLVDEKVYLRPLTGAVNGKNAVFGLQDTPTDGNARPTDDPAQISVYVGSDALEALANGEVDIVRLDGKGQKVTLENPPVPSIGNQQTQKVYATYYRNALASHVYTVSVVAPGFAGFGTYSIADELGRVLPLVKNTTNTVADGGFATTGIVYPFSFPDAQSPADAIDETITLTFNNDGTGILVPAVQASLAVVINAVTLTFTASVPGAIGNNVKIAVNAVDQNAEPVVVNGDNITIYSNWDGVVKTGTQIGTYFPSALTVSGGAITLVVSGTAANQVNASASAAPLAGGTDATTTPVSHSYTVSSNQVGGSSGVGYLDQTYVDAKTGFRVTIVNPADHVAFGVPSIPSNYVYAPADVLHFTVSKSAARHTGTPNVGNCEANNQVAIGGLRSQVVSNFGSTAGDTVVITTMRLSGNNPNVGEFYFVTFNTTKTDSDMALALYTNTGDAYAKYGQPSVQNRLSLAIQLLTANGAQAFGAIQVRKQPGLGVASDADFLAALTQLTKPLPGGDHKADVIVPLSTSGAVQNALSRQVTIQSGVRQKGEAIGFVGFDQFATPQSMRASARAIKNARIIAIGNPAASILLTNPTTGVSQEQLVTGEFLAAAMAGMNCNPSNDVSTSLTKQTMSGFERMLIRYDDPTMDQMAADGLTMIVEKNGSFQVRHYKSTDPSNPVTSEPTSTTAVDFTRQAFRTDLDQFIGRKFTDSLVSDVTVVSNARLRSLVDNNILSGYKNLKVVPDASDPTVLKVTVDVKPIFSLLYIGVTFTVTTNL